MDGLIALALAKKASADATKTLQGTGAPTSSIVAKKGDLYLDTTNNQVYMCTQYIDPNAITDLSGLTVTFKNTAYDRTKMPEGYTYVNFTCDGTSYASMRNLYDWTEMNYGGTRVNNWQGWESQTYRTVTFTGGTGATNAAFITFVIGFADSITGAGSQWIALDSELPAVSALDNGKVLGVDNGGWAKIDVPSDLPTISGGDAGKALVVNAGETGAEWASIGGVSYFSGSGAPTAEIVCKVGDIYRDTSTNRLYQCSNYAPTISLVGHTISWKYAPDFSDVSAGDHIYNLTFTYDSNSFSKINIGGNKIIQYGNPSLVYVYSYNGGGWYYDAAKVIEVTGGTDATNADLIAFVEKNATISGTGSTWVEIVAIPDGIPTINSSDEGKVLTVDSNGDWTVSEIANTGVSYYEGSADPVSSIVCKKGDLYRNTTSGDTYICTNYIDPNNVTDLTGITIYFKDANNMNLNSIVNSRVSVNFTCDNVSYNEMLYDGTYKEFYYFPVGSSSAAVGKFGGVPIEWFDEKYRTITFTGGTDATNSTVITAMLSNALSYNGLGSTWAKVVPDELPSTTSSDEGKLLQVNSSGSWNKSNAFEEETWTFTLTDNTTITRTVLVKVVE